MVRELLGELSIHLHQCRDEQSSKGTQGPACELLLDARRAATAAIAITSASEIMFSIVILLAKPEVTSAE
jgi:hypothetical protein